jgi:hypothetical protein
MHVFIKFHYIKLHHFVFRFEEHKTTPTKKKKHKKNRNFLSNYYNVLFFIIYDINDIFFIRSTMISKIKGEF